MKLKAELDHRGLKETVRANAAGCLDTCEQGISVVVYPEGVWYGHVTTDDIEELVEWQVISGKPVERLRMRLPTEKP